MNTIKVLLLAVLLMAMGTPAFAQGPTVRTDLDAVLPAGTNNTQVTLASVTGITASTSSAQTFIFIGDSPATGEQMQVQSISGSILTVRRAVRGNANAHPINSIVWFGTPGSFIGNNTSGVFVGTTPSGQCTRASNQFLPVVNPNTGDVSDCITSPAQGSPTGAASTTSTWVSTSFYQRAFSRPYKKLAITATTYTLLASDSILGYNTSATGTVTIPALTGAVGKEYTIQLEITGTASITLAGSSSQTINGAASITVPIGSTSFGRVDIYSDGVNWFAGRSN